MDNQTILDIISKPKSYAIDGESVTNQSVGDAIAALEYARKSKKPRDPWAALGIAKIQTQGASR